MIRNEATERQVQAARPDLSTWLSANAGSGKTRVLTDRVARLLLNGVSPEHILCLTYTKAAASEMQNRLFRRLGKWAMLDDAPLRDELRELGVDTVPSGQFLNQARTLFARAIETPGGLRIQTIHSFCASLLRRFPLEAQVSPQFQEMEDRAAELMRAELLDRIADGPQAQVVADLAAYLTTDDLEKLLRDLVQNTAAFLPPRDDAAVRALYDLPHGLDRDSLLAGVFLGGEVDFLAELVPHLAASGPNDQKTAAKLDAVTGADMASLNRLEDALLLKTGENAGQANLARVPTKGVRKAADHLMPQLDALMLRVEAARPLRLSQQAADRDIALHRFAQVFLPAYATEKQRRGWLDFDDLIAKASALLNDRAVAEWVLYRLDGGIDHILVDEAQDTSPVQWQVITRLAQEFTSGDGARTDIRRTIFVVGDKKQSIYSFQGADPDEFDRMRADFAERLAATDAPLSNLTLDFSFRSAEPVLRLVDNTFAGRNDAGFSTEQQHRAFKSEMPGRVDLWPLVEKTADDKDGPWFEPVDQVGRQHHTVVLAQRIAHFMADSIGKPLPVEQGQTGSYTARPIHAGDFLILVRGRSRLFIEIIRACKQAGLPIAGADRLKVTAELAVRDLGALLSVLDTPEDDLALATALRSPLFGLSEQQLFDLAHRRTAPYLWIALRERRDEFPQAMAILDDLGAKADFLRPYDLIERILTRHNGRKRLLGRLGEEAEDGINALLQQALAFEQSAVPSLTGFLQWMQSDDLEIKRAADSAGERVRVMTVHGAKGLEAPIVILPDCAQPNTTLRGNLLRHGADAVWKQTSDQMPPLHDSLSITAKEAEARERDRLLYVALTRAESWLIVAAAGDLGKKGEAWYDKVSEGMRRSGAAPHPYDFGDLGGGDGLVLGQTDWSVLDLEIPDTVQRRTVDLPPQFSRPAPEPQLPAPTLSPSDLGGPKALPGMDGLSEEAAKRRGTLIHALLEHLPAIDPRKRPEIGPLILSRLDKSTTNDEAQALTAGAIRLLDLPDLAPFFAPETLAEVQLTAAIPEMETRLSGVIDRLIVTDTQVTAVDFKTNHTVPATPQACPDGLLRQLGAYAAILAQIYPERAIEVGILWTETAHYMPMPAALITQALDRAGMP
ncbi:double-strand break repair helicase AddA [Puniceibacterium sp. IMCC21224]|uniref:double-strand break repair helicase AddA n=1 Tax=Puniceibacterium sp. IMCC21224 TaxID=1618204 RepID=UPI00064DDFB1|nr:double-strand break repair helicase AddA [Puniceibacterium sp. IMCC21224]KMK65293.1 DNA helicase/exodeoxyribonuclease V, subunit A [Puniceibacterium sp. IMCC21224]